jgi:hypothetical protein
MKNPSQTNRKLMTFPIKDYPNIQVNSGTMDRDTMKACYLEFKGTIQTDGEDKIKDINRVCKNISRSISNSINTDLFYDKFLCSKDISESFVYTGKSYTKIEYTLFLKQPLLKEQLTSELNKLTDKVWTESIQDTSSVKFYKNIISKRKYK